MPLSNGFSVIHYIPLRAITISPEIIIYPLEASLLLRQRSSAKDRFQVNPLALNLVHVVQILVQVSKTLLPDGGFVCESLVVRGIFQGLEKTLVVSNLQRSRMKLLNILSLQARQNLLFAYLYEWVNLQIFRWGQQI